RTRAYDVTAIVGGKSPFGLRSPYVPRACCVFAAKYTKKKKHLLGEPSLTSEAAGLQPVGTSTTFDKIGRLLSVIFHHVRPSDARRQSPADHNNGLSLEDGRV
ncbi:hypothetical protein CHARACLAT_029750, partial [Characodon lateralis]|nr:hypothetical protein [Characodon lateralis]